MTKVSTNSRVPQLARECLAEVFGTAILLAFGSGVVAQVNLTGLGAYFSINAAWACGVTFGVLASVRVSGAHLNPAVTFSSCIFGGFPWKKLAPYVASQVLGAFLGACITYACYFKNITVYDLSTAGIFATYPNPAMSHWSALINEVFGTALLTAAIAAITDSKDDAPCNRFHVAGFVGLIVLAIGMAFGANTGYAINPARDFGPRLFTWMAGWGSQVFTAADYYFWVPIVGPLIGGPLGMGLQKLVLQ